jgi:hypothetical protein
MSKHTIPADGGAMPAEAHKTRRAALALFGAAPALAILPAIAVASPASTARLADLIASHDVALTAMWAADEAAGELADPDFSSVSFLGRPLQRSIDDVEATRERLIQETELMCELEIRRIDTLLRVSPELGEAALAVLEKGRADCLAQIDDVHADYLAAERAVNEADKVRNEALLAVCGHRCASVDELTIKVRYLASWGRQLLLDQSAAFYRSLLPEGEEIAAV